MKRDTQRGGVAAAFPVRFRFVSRPKTWYRIGTVCTAYLALSLTTVTTLTTYALQKQREKLQSVENAGCSLVTTKDVMKHTAH